MTYRDDGTEQIEISPRFNRTLNASFHIPKGWRILDNEMGGITTNMRHTLVIADTHEAFHEICQSAWGDTIIDLSSKEATEFENNAKRLSGLFGVEHQTIAAEPNPVAMVSLATGIWYANAFDGKSADRPACMVVALSLEDLLSTNRGLLLLIQGRAMGIHVVIWMSGYHGLSGRGASLPDNTATYILAAGSTLGKEVIGNLRLSGSSMASDVVRIFTPVSD